MAVQGRSRSSSATVFPRGVFAAGPFEPVRDFDASKDGRVVQSKDKVTGLPMWAAEVIDGDPAARVKSLRVKVAVADRPVLPAPHPGMPFVPVEFASLTITRTSTRPGGWPTPSKPSVSAPLPALAAARRTERRRRHEADGYTYTTISTRPGERPRIGVAF